MKLHHLLTSTAMAAAFALGLSAPAYADEKVEMKDLPAAVQKTIQDYLAGGTVTGIDKESENGKTSYSADVKKPNGERVEIKVAEDGKLIKAEGDEKEVEQEGEHEGED
jgi:hypothetical protein